MASLPALAVNHVHTCQTWQVLAPYPACSEWWDTMAPGKTPGARAGSPNDSAFLAPGHCDVITATPGSPHVRVPHLEHPLPGHYSRNFGQGGCAFTPG